MTRFRCLIVISAIFSSIRSSLPQEVLVLPGRPIRKTWFRTSSDIRSSLCFFDSTKGLSSTGILRLEASIIIHASLPVIHVISGGTKTWNSAYSEYLARDEMNVGKAKGIAIRSQTSRNQLDWFRSILHFHILLGTISINSPQAGFLHYSK